MWYQQLLSLDLRLDIKGKQYLETQGYTMNQDKITNLTLKRGKILISNLQPSLFYEANLNILVMLTLSRVIPKYHNKITFNQHTFFIQFLYEIKHRLNIQREYVQGREIAILLEQGVLGDGEREEVTRDAAFTEAGETNDHFSVTHPERKLVKLTVPVDWAALSSAWLTLSPDWLKRRGLQLSNTRLGWRRVPPDGYKTCYKTKSFIISTVQKH